MKESLEDRTFEIIQSEEQKEKKNKKEFKKKKAHRIYGTESKETRSALWKFQKEKRKGCRVFEIINAENFLNLKKEKDIQIWGPKDPK